MTKTYIAPGTRSPFVKAGTAYTGLDGLQLSKPIVQSMAEASHPDFIAWGQVIPNPTISNLARELVLEAGLDPTIPAFSTQLACSTSMMGAIQAAGMLGKGGAHLALVGGVETMSRVPIGLKSDAAQKLMMLFATDPSKAAREFAALTAADFDLPVNGWANRITGRSMGQHTEDTAQTFAISRADQDSIAFKSHTNTFAAQKAGFFDDLIVPVSDVIADTLARSDTSIGKLSTLKPVFDRSDKGTLTAGNSSPLTDGAAGVWVADQHGLETLKPDYAVELVDWQIEAMQVNEEGILMAPARAIPKLLARHGLRLDDIALFEIHEAFAAQVLANIQAISDQAYQAKHTGVTQDMGSFPFERLNRTGGSLAIGHPFAATGARILSQTAKALSDLPSGSYALVSICADGGQGTATLLCCP